MECVEDWALFRLLTCNPQGICVLKKHVSKPICWKLLQGFPAVSSLSIPIWCRASSSIILHLHPPSTVPCMMVLDMPQEMAKPWPDFCCLRITKKDSWRFLTKFCTWMLVFSLHWPVISTPLHQWSRMDTTSDQKKFVSWCCSSRTSSVWPLLLRLFECAALCYRCRLEHQWYGCWFCAHAV